MRRRLRQRVGFDPGARRGTGARQAPAAHRPPDRGGGGQQRSDRGVRREIVGETAAGEREPDQQPSRRPEEGPQGEGDHAGRLPRAVGDALHRGEPARRLGDDEPEIEDKGPETRLHGGRADCDPHFAPAEKKGSGVGLIGHRRLPGRLEGRHAQLSAAAPADRRRPASSPDKSAGTVNDWCRGRAPCEARESAPSCAPPRLGWSALRFPDARERAGAVQGAAGGRLPGLGTPVDRIAAGDPGDRRSALNSRGFAGRRLRPLRTARPVFCK